MSFTYNRAEILKAAHFMTRWRRASGVKGTYREIFARELAAQWKKAKAAQDRFEQNTGLPIRSCHADAHWYPSNAQARVFSGPGAFEAAIANNTNRVAASFIRDRAAGRRASWVA